MTKRVITTVGTSLFTNYMKKEVKDAPEFKEKGYKSIDSIYGKLENAEVGADTKDLAKIIKDYWLDKFRPEASAEIESLIEISKTDDSLLEVFLYSSDTALSKTAADLIEEYLNTSCPQDKIKITEKKVISGLKVNDYNRFRSEGVINLFKEINKDIIDETYAPYIAINITGGYKATIPYLTIIGQINNIPIYYIFEDSGKLIKFPPLPIIFDYGFIGQYLYSFEELTNTQEGIWDSYKAKNQLPDAFDGYIDSINDHNGGSLFELNVIGKYLLDRFKNYFLLSVENSCGLFGENPGNRSQILRAIRELYARLMNEIGNNNLIETDALRKHITNLGDKNDLRHGSNPLSDMFIFKSTDETQIRIVYQPTLKSGFLSIKIFDYHRGASNFNHSEYINQFSKKIKGKSEFMFTTLAIKK